MGLLKPPRSWPGAKPSPEAAVGCVPAIFHNDGTGVNGFLGLMTFDDPAWSEMMWLMLVRPTINKPTRNGDETVSIIPI